MSIRQQSIRLLLLFQVNSSTAFNSSTAKNEKKTNLSDEMFPCYEFIRNKNFNLSLIFDKKCSDCGLSTSSGFCGSNCRHIFRRCLFILMGSDSFIVKDFSLTKKKKQNQLSCQIFFYSHTLHLP